MDQDLGWDRGIPGWGWDGRYGGMGSRFRDIRVIIMGERGKGVKGRRRRRTGRRGRMGEDSTRLESIRVNTNSQMRWSLSGD